MKFKIYRIKASQQVGMTDEDGKNVSSKKFQIKTNRDNATYNILKYKVVLIEM